MTLLLGLWRILRLQIWLSLLVPSTPELSHYFDPEHDKFATEDVFYQLAEAGELTAYKPPVNLTEVSASLRSFTVTVYVEVKLLGFSWYSTDQPVIEASKLTDLLDIVRRDRAIHVSHPHHYRLASSKKVVFHVTKASKELEDRTRETLNTQLLAGKTRIHYRVLDDILSEDFKSSPTSAFTVYLLAFPHITQSHSKQSYWYSLSPESGCGTTVWAGKERYLWIDLSAGPVEISALKDSSNLVNQWTLPRLEQYGSSEDFRDVEFMSAVASLLNQVAEQQIFPSFQFLRPYTDARQIVLQLVLISDELLTSADRGISHSIDWPLFRDTIGRLSLHGQKLLYKVTPLVLESCSHCVAAFSHALATSVQALKLNGSAVVTHQYLDSIELHHWLAKFRDLFKLPPLPELSLSPFKTYFALPIFLFDLSGYHSLLLDDSRQSVAFEDMVIAVRTQSSKKTAGFQCTGNEPQFDTSDVTRPVLASVLESLYGLLPTESFLNIAKNESQLDLLWATGFTPFSYLSSSQEISFAVREAALRAPVFRNVEKNLLFLSEAVDHYQDFEVAVCAALSKLDCAQFAMRWELLHYKLTRTMSLLSVGNYQHSLYFSRSLRFETAAMKYLLKEAEKSVYPRLRCEGVPLSVWSLPGVFVFCFVCLVVVVLVIATKVLISKTGVLTAARTRYTKPKLV